MRWVPWGWKNLGELNLHYENGPPHSGIHLNGYQHMPRVQEQLTELIFVHFSGRSTHSSKGHLTAKLDWLASSLTIN